MKGFDQGASLDVGLSLLRRRIGVVQQRGAGPLEDAENIRTLLDSAKEESELTMCTDVDRNDKSRVCVPAPSGSSGAGRSRCTAG